VPSSFPHEAFFIVHDTEIARRIWTVGHSTHSFERLVELLRMHSIEALADVRKIPKSRRMPWFAGDELASSLPAEGIEYHHFSELGGFRRPRADSPNAGWEHESFRGYADHMESDEFARGIERLQALADRLRTAVMCAEAQWHRCHRRLLADALLARGWEVLHIGSNGRATAHELTPFAVRDGIHVTYPPPQGTLGFA
jgi:uncharacterized protein (DUF488 family)